jgi:hypothetical protein
LCLFIYLYILTLEQNILIQILEYIIIFIINLSLSLIFHNPNFC